MSHYDIMIVGSGIVGSVAALAFAKNSSLKIALLESQPISFAWSAEKYDHRVSAISLASKRILQNLGVWSHIQKKRLTPYTHMQVWDESGSGKIHFDCQTVQESALGYIVEDSVMRTTLLEMLSHTRVDLISPIKLISLKKKSDCIELEAQSGKLFSAKLVIAADGANSWVREQANIALKNNDYDQTAIVATVQTTLSHQHTAWQRFLTTGPLALLPLPEMNTCSIVWSATHAYAEELLTLNDEQFSEKLTRASEKKLGEITQVSKRYHFPLRMRHAKNYVEEHLALIGDAAHTIHPLAGQGVNLGLLDAASLVEVVIDAVHKNRDFFSQQTLRRYERWRKSDNLTMLFSVDVLKQLFIQENSFIKNLRNTSLSLTDRFGLLKNILTNYALGNRDDLPELSKKEVIGGC
jgi:2-octaprenylphenol hydroxylase